MIKGRIRRPRLGPGQHPIMGRRLPRPRSRFRAPKSIEKVPLQEFAERMAAEIDETDNCPECGGAIECAPPIISRSIKFWCKTQGCSWSWPSISSATQDPAQ